MKRPILLSALMLVSSLVFSQPASRQFPPLEGEGKTAVICHRGYWNCEEGQNAKNSIASLAAAQKYGFWGSEFDVNMTKDGVLLVFHDGSIKIDGEKKRIDQNNYEVFKDYRLVNGEPIPTLADYLVQARKSPKTKMVF